MHRLNAIDGVSAMFSRRSEMKLCAESIEKLIAHFLPDTHGAITLHIAMSTYRTWAGTGPSDVAAQQQKIDHLLDRGHRVFVLGQSHGPTTDNGASIQRNFCCCSNLLPAQAAACENFFPTCRTQTSDELVIANRVLPDEIPIKDFSGTPIFLGKHLFYHPSEQGDVSIDANR